MPIILRDMPSRRWRSLLALPVLLAGCNDRALEQRTEQIEQLSDRENRVYSSEALMHIRRKYWTYRDHAWLGKLPDGTIVRLESPHATAAPLLSRAFYSGWHLQLTISSEDWRTYPPERHENPFAAVYAITRHSATSWDIRVIDGEITSPLQKEDAARLQDGR
jgi:hypothetical protein